jgi:DNA-binding transcriptional MerR regulator
MNTSERGYLSIGEVLGLLHEEFPDVTISKIRFLESQGLIDPERTASGYRKFYDDDVERLRFILREQREHFLPLRVIKGRLDGTTDEGETPSPPREASVARETAPKAAVSGQERLPIWMSQPPPVRARELPEAAAPAEAALDPGATSAAPDLSALVPTSASLTIDELAVASGLPVTELSDLTRHGLLVGKPMGSLVYYDEAALVLARLAASFLRYGIEARHLRAFRTSAEREAGLVEQIILPLVKQRNPQARADALAAAAELARLGDELHAALVRQALRPYLDGP